MPRLRRATVRGRELDYPAFIALESGHDFFNEWEDPDEYEAAWVSVRDWLLPEYIALAPTTRPAAWWRIDAPEKMRRCISGSGNSHFRDPDAPEWTRKLYFGAPCVIGYDDWKNPSTYESQVEYLNRLDLLEASEVAWLDALAASADPTYRQPEFDVRTWWDRRKREFI